MGKGIQGLAYDVGDVTGYQLELALHTLLRGVNAEVLTYQKIPQLRESQLQEAFAKA